MSFGNFFFKGLWGAFGLLVFSGLVMAGDFQLTSLPRGKSVTLPRPATTLIPLTEAATLSSTDKSQTLKFSSISVSGGKADPIKISIYDKHSEKPRHLVVKAGSPMVYTFKGLSSIRIQTATIGAGLKTSKSTKLRVESNRPLGIARN